MNQRIKRTLALVVALAACLSFFSVFSIGTNAATVDYTYAGNYVYNWGEREELATFLSPMAEAFYEEAGNKSFLELIEYSGGTGVADAPESELYEALQKLMKDNHSHETDYQETRPLYQYTDCENGGGRISSFYSGDPIGPAWDGGGTWNREHTWPNSKGLEGRDEDDIMMLRPTATSENGGRSNKAYGKSNGYYYPNSESNDEHDVRGDVSRIFLYTYVRWGVVDGNGSFDTWGQRGVMESLDVLLEWIEADPVDTWELGRNDSVEAITGTRNVFVDYPELAFLLFGADVPDDMETPSGMAKAGVIGCDHVYDNDCDTDCNLCGDIRTAANHVYDNDCDTDCNLCGEKREVGKHTYSAYCDTTCDKCGLEREAKHLYSGWQVIKEPTTEEKGTERGSCIYCGEQTERDIDKLSSPNEDNPPAGDPVDPPSQDECEHTFGEWQSGENGEEYRTCTKCEKQETRPKEDNTEAPDEDNTGVYITVIAIGCTVALGGVVAYLSRRKRF